MPPIATNYLVRKSLLSDASSSAPEGFKAGSRLIVEIASRTSELAELFELPMLLSAARASERCPCF